MRKILFLIITLFFLLTWWVFADNYSQDLFDNKYLAKEEFFWKNYTTWFEIWNNSWSYIFWTNGNISDNTNANFVFDNNFTGNVEIRFILDKNSGYANHSSPREFSQNHNDEKYTARREVTDKLIIETFLFPIKDQKEFNLDFHKILNNYYKKYILDINISLSDENKNKISIVKFYFSNSNHKNFIYSHDFASQSDSIQNLPLDNIINNFRTLNNLDKKNIFILNKIKNSQKEDIVKLLYWWENRIILDTQINQELLIYLFWENYKKYENITYYNKYLNLNVKNIYDLPVFTNEDKKYVKIPVIWYKKWDIIINKFDEKLHHYFGSNSVMYYKKTNIYNQNTGYFYENKLSADLSEKIREKYSFLSKTFAYMIISYLFILFWSIFFFFNSWKNRFKNIYIISWLSLIYLIIYWVIFLITIGNNDNINYVIERQIYDNFEVQTHNIYDFSLSNDSIDFENKADEIFQVLWKRHIWYSQHQRENKNIDINYSQVPMNATELKFNVIKFSENWEFTTNDNSKIVINQDYFKYYYNQSQNYSADKIFHTNQKNDVFYDVYKSSDRVNYFLIEAKY